MGESADILVITDALDDGSRAVSKFLYQCRTGSCLRVVERPEDVAPAISRYDSIQRLVFLLEGGGGHLTVGGVDKELDWYAEQLGGTRTRVKKEIAFDGCDIAKGGARGSPSS